MQAALETSYSKEDMIQSMQAMQLQQSQRQRVVEVNFSIHSFEHVPEELACMRRTLSARAAHQILINQSKHKQAEQQTRTTMGQIAVLQGQVQQLREEQVSSQSSLAETLVLRVIILG